MPQLDIDLFDEFIFFAFISLILGLGDEDVEENLIADYSDTFLIHFYFDYKNQIKMERELLEVIINNSSSTN